MPASTGPHISWPAIQSALEAWIVAATGLQAAQVIHKNKKVPQPMPPYVELRPGTLATVGQDELREITNLANAGAEIELQVIGRRSFTVSVQAYSAAADAVDNGAVDLLTKAKMALALPSRLAAFRAAGLSLIEAEAVLDLSTRTPGGTGRASMDVRFNVTDSASEFTGYIATVNLSPINTP
jgi:hypothetical protein